MIKWVIKKNGKYMNGMTNFGSLKNADLFDTKKSAIGCMRNLFNSDELVVKVEVTIKEK